VGSLSAQNAIDNAVTKGKGPTQGISLYLPSNNLERAVDFLATRSIGRTCDAVGVDADFVVGLSGPLDARMVHEGANAELPILPDFEFLVPTADAAQKVGAEEHACGVERGGEQLGGWRTPEVRGCGRNRLRDEAAEARGQT